MTELNDLERIRLEKAERLRRAGLEPLEKLPQIDFLRQQKTRLA